MFKKGFLMLSGLEPTQDGAGPKTGTVGEGEEVGEILMMALAGVLGADMLFLKAMVGSGWIFERREVAFIDSWDSENFQTSSSMFMSSLLTHESCIGE